MLIDPEGMETGSCLQRESPGVPRAGTGEVNGSLVDPLMSSLSHCHTISFHGGFLDKGAILKDKNEAIH